MAGSMTISASGRAFPSSPDSIGGPGAARIRFSGTSGPPIASDGARTTAERSEIRYPPHHGTTQSNHRTRQKCRFVPRPPLRSSRGMTRKGCTRLRIFIPLIHDRHRLEPKDNDWETTTPKMRTAAIGRCRGETSGTPPTAKEPPRSSAILRGLRVKRFPCRSRSPAPAHGREPAPSPEYSPKPPRENRPKC